MKKGMVFIISAPSGAGKSSLIKSVLKKKILFDITISISHTTRPIRPGEHNGKQYYFISKSKFKDMIKKNEFLEYAKIFNHYYGTSRKVICNILSKGLDVFLDIDWQGAKQVKKNIKCVKSIFILPPSKKELYYRLYTRGQDSNDIINIRMKKASNEMSHYIEYDYLIINDNFDLAVSNIINIVSVERLSISYQQHKYYYLIKNLLKK